MGKYKFTRQDLSQINDKGIPLESIELQLEHFRKGFPPVELTAPATPGKGIICLNKEEVKRHANSYENVQQDLKTVKFIPASGAASRMFQSLFEFLQEAGNDAARAAGKSFPEIKQLIEGLPQLALTDHLREVLLKTGKDLDALVSGKEYLPVIRGIIGEDGLNYGKMPKGLIKFHKYPEENRTPVEEHLVEGAAYCTGRGENVSIHFTVSSEHLDGLMDLLARLQPVYEKRFGVHYQVSFSIQRAFTDTIAVDTDNHPFRDTDGRLVFRPGGHGALLANLNALDADLVFIKNIDNVCPDRLKPMTILYKKALAGLLLEIQQKAFAYIRLLDLDDPREELLAEIRDFLVKRMNYIPSPADDQLCGKESASCLKKILNRPLRICGMVRNEGEPGGGPFWTRNAQGSVSLQIVEASQINFAETGQADMVKRSTHFNPVDLVCGIRDYQEKLFDLQRFTDPSTGFISTKSRDGKTIKVQELPGLWNGSMAGWNTLFVEVPVETFNPVKTINDLLRPEHIAGPSTDGA
jgi:hypothetical protein